MAGSRSTSHVAAGLGLLKVGEKCGVPNVLVSSSCTCAGSGERSGQAVLAEGLPGRWGRWWTKGLQRGEVVSQGCGIAQ